MCVSCKIKSCFIVLTSVMPDVNQSIAFINDL